jgi:hypothetical protein
MPSKFDHDINGISDLWKGARVTLNFDADSRKHRVTAIEFGVDTYGRDAGTSDTIPITYYHGIEGDPLFSTSKHVKRANVIPPGSSTGNHLALHSGTVEGSTSGVERDMEQHVEEGH